MVRLLDRFWGAKVGPACRAGHSKSRAADGTYRKTSFRPQLEPLEDRLTPAGLNFLPSTHIAVNPQPLPPGQTLPPSVLVELDSLVPPALDANDKGFISIHFSGIKSDKVTVISPSGTLQQWFVKTLYDLEI